MIRAQKKASQDRKAYYASDNLILKCLVMTIKESHDITQTEFFALYLVLLKGNTVNVVMDEGT